MLNVLSNANAAIPPAFLTHQYENFSKSPNSAEIRKSALESVLRELNSSSSDIEASACISSDGFNIASVLGKGVDADRYGAMCASLLALANRAAQEVQRGSLKLVMVEGELGIMLLVQAGQDAILAVAAKPGRNLGMIFMNSKKYAQKVLTTLNSYPIR
jgi:hypothetical protein